MAPKKPLEDAVFIRRLPSEPEIEIRYCWFSKKFLAILGIGYARGGNRAQAHTLSADLSDLELFKEAP